VSGLDGVAGREDVGRGRAHLRVDRDASAGSDLDPGVAGEVDVGTCPGRHHHDVGLDRRAVGEIDHEPVVAVANGLGRSVEAQIHVVGVDVEVQDAGHLVVEPRHQAGGALDHGRLQPA
jgi:hypothetical protein